MLARLIAFLQWIESSEKPKKWIDFFFSFALMMMSMSLIYKIFSETIFARSYNYYDRYAWSGGLAFASSITGDIWIFSSILILLIAIVAIYLYGIYKKATKKDFSLVRVIMNGVLPLTVGILLIFLHVSEPTHMKWYLYLFGGFYALSPFFLFLSGFEWIHRWFLEKICDLSKKYAIAFLIGLAIFIPLFLLGEVYSDLRYSKLGEIIIISFFSICGYSIAVWFVLAYAWMELDEVSEISWKNILRSGVTIAFIFLVIWLSPNWKEYFITSRINTAKSILIKEGETKKWLEKASDLAFLKWALKEKYRDTDLYGDEKELYAKLYDTSIESDIDDEIDVEKYKARNSNATSMLARGENAKVELNFAKHESEILSDIGAVKTTVTYEFQNTTSTNQEVVFSIVLPNAESAMTDLRLGTNLEYIGVIAPRGAASKVYQDSLRRNTDPALLEQTWPVSYRLRVFPVTSMGDPKTQGRQRVQYSYVSPLASDGSVTVIPKTDILNLKLTKKSEIMTRVMEGTKALIQDSRTGDDLDTLWEGKVEKVNITLGKTYANFCSVNRYSGIDMTTLTSIEKKLSKNIVFFDISKSAWETSGIKKKYQSLVDVWKNNGVSLDIYSYNFDIYPSGYDLDKIDFWGTTDMAAIIDYLEKNTISDANIVIVTDDNSYERANTELKTIDYKRLKSNRISLIQIGGKVRTLKSEITKSILATDGSMIIIDNGSDFSDAVKDIFTPRKTVEKCENYTGSSLSDLSILQGYSDGRIMFGEEISHKELLQEARNGDIFTWWILNPTIQYLIFWSNMMDIDPLLESALTKDEVIIVRSIPNSLIPYEIYDGATQLRFNSNYDDYINYKIKRLEKYTWRLIEISDFAWDDNVPDNLAINIKYSLFLWKPIPLKSDSRLFAEKLSNNLIQEEIATATHIVTQSTSLIALETDSQRADLKRYSQQDDKYDTQYENFANTNMPPNSPRFDRQEIIVDDMIMSPQGISMSTPNSNLFGAKRSTSLSVWNNSLKGEGMSLDAWSSSGNSSVWLMQYIIALIFFPLIAWFVLRRKPKAKIEEKKKELQNPKE